MSDSNVKPLLSVRDLVVEFKTEHGVVRAVDGVSFDVMPGETLGIVGESGCGKSVTSLAVLGLIPSPPGRIASGTIEFNGKNLVGLSESDLRKVRGKDIAMIFQDPMTALNPVYTIGNQLSDVLCRHKKMSRSQAKKQAIRLLEIVGIPSPARRVDNYPHEMSGGMRQRVMIAMALSCGPKLLLADEPTTALDVTTQAQVLDEINKLQGELRMSVVLVTHDMGVVAETCQRVAVMYCGKVIESALVADIFAHPRHPYTRGLLDSIPQIREEKIDRLPVIEGMVPDLQSLPVGCRFADRCPKVQERCRLEQPPLTNDGVSSYACFYPNTSERST